MKKMVSLLLFFLVLIFLTTTIFLYLRNKERISENDSLKNEIDNQIDNKIEKQIENPPQKEQYFEKPKIQIVQKEKLPLSIENISVLPYEGKNANFMPLLNANSSVETSIQTAVKILEEKSALYPTREDVITIYLTESKNITKGYPYFLKQNPDGNFTIVLSLQKVLFNSLPVHELVASGIAESLLTKRNKNFIKLPKFFRVGAAMSLSGLNNYIEKQEVLEIERDGEKPQFSVLYETSHPVLNGIFLFRFLLEKSEKNHPEEILQLFSEDKEFSKLLEESSKFSFAEFEQNYLEYSKNRYQNYSRFFAQFLKIVGYLRSLKEEEALPLLQEFLRTNPTDIHYGEALYYLGYTNYRLGDYSEAEKIFNTLLLNHSYETISHGKAHFFLGRCYHLRGYESLALPEYIYASIDENELLRNIANRKIDEISK